MESVINNPQITSLAVAIIALIGVFSTTLLQTASAEKRRRRDQRAEDQRKVREQTETLRLKRLEEQRRAVVKCSGGLRELEMQSRAGVMKSVLGLFPDGGRIGQIDRLKIDAKYAIATLDFYNQALNIVDELCLEITDKKVYPVAESLKKALENEYNQLVPSSHKDPKEWMNSFESHSLPSDEVQELLTELTVLARNRLHWIDREDSEEQI